MNFNTKYEWLCYNEFNMKEFLGKKIEETLDNYHVKGASIAIVDSYKIDFFKPCGIVDSEKQEKITKDTLFQVASISKPVFACGIISLYNKGIIDIDCDIDKYLKTWQLERIPDRKVSIANLLSHNGGTNVGGFKGYKNKEKIPTTIDILNGKGNSEKIVCNIPAYSYSGGGYTILQHFIEELFGDFSKFMQKEVFDIVGMENSKYLPQLTNLDKLASENYNLYPEYAAAGLYSTAYDLAKLGNFLQKQLLGEGIIKKEIVEKFLTRINDGYHGLGFRISQDGNIFWHGGINNDFYSHFVFTKDGRGIVILTNGNSREVFDKLEKLIKDFYNWNDIVLNSFNSK